MPEVSKRPYRSQLRERQAAATRQRIVEAAAEVFGAEGYASATLTKIAQRAGVAIETVVKQGSKAALLRAAAEYSSFGTEGAGDIFDTDVGKALQALTSADQVPGFAAEAFAVVNGRGARLWSALTSGASEEPELASYHEVVLADIRVQAARILGMFAERGWLRLDVEFDDVVEAFCVLSSFESYLRFVHHDGKSPEAYRAFIARTMRESILDS